MLLLIANTQRHILDQSTDPWVWWVTIIGWSALYVWFFIMLWRQHKWNLRERERNKAERQWWVDEARARRDVARAKFEGKR